MHGVVCGAADAIGSVLAGWLQRLFG